jgi:hypothetical protein
VDEDDLVKIKRDLIDKVLVPEVMKKFKEVDKDVQALARRINSTIPFLPFTKDERRVVTDLEIRKKFQQWSSPAVLTNCQQNLHKNKLYGNLQLIHTRDFLKHAASQYVPMEGASSVSRVVEQVDGDFILRLSEKRFQLSEDEWKVIRSDKPRPKGCPEPKFWVDYDEDDKIIRTLKKADYEQRLGSPHKSVKDPSAVCHDDSATVLESGDKPGDLVQGPETSEKVNSFA